MTHKSTLTLTYKTENKVSSIDDVYPANYEFTLTVDATDATSSQLFFALEKVLLSAGFSERGIMKGAAEALFNDTRTARDMYWVAKEVDIDKEDMRKCAEEETARMQAWGDA